MDNRLTIPERVSRYIDSHIPLPADPLILVGLSGGADSVALLSILTGLGYRCVVCHCNFGLRGEEALRDQDFARSVAERLGVPFCEIAFETREYAETHKISIEMACRELRYGWFEQQRRDLGADYIAVAHHRDDSNETLLLNLLRGTGISGLTGIQPVNGRVIRPLLSLSRTEIESYLAEYNLAYVVDSTNRETFYTRNKIRLQLLPFMREINPAIDDTLAHTTDYLRDVETIYRESIDRYKQQLLSRQADGLHIDIARLLALPVARTILYEIIKEYGFRSSQLDDIWDSCRAASGVYFDAPVYRLLRDRDDFIIYPRRIENKEVLIDRGTTVIDTPVSLTFSLHEAQGYEIPRRCDTACFDADRLPFPLTLRSWKEGDRFRPFGMKGSQKLSDYFNNNKFSLARKQSTWLLCAGEEIVWIVGERAADLYKVSAETRQIWEIKCKK